ncbi:hypothetical protein [Streptomyces sp. NBC_01506]|uniref:hypothetical protein n=1 Tax=Streptomyces sp. NBC_01506 TaxID=2903887 RepID=UPI0038643977
MSSGARTISVPWTRRVLALLAGGMVAAVAAGCSDSREYAVPDTVCETPADADLLAPLLPNGDAFEQKRSNFGEESWSCRLQVDKALVLYVKGDVVPADVDPIKVKEEALGRMGHPEKADIGDDARVADQGALAVVACPRPNDERKFVMEIESMSDTPKDTSERRQALSRFLDSYLTQALKAQGCPS